MYFIKKKHLLWGIIFSITGIAIGAFVKFSPYTKTFLPKRNITVIVDAGHGNPDGGAVGVNGTVEEIINLKIAQKLCEVLQGKGISAIMTRTDESALSEEKENIRIMKREDMSKRMDIMKKSKADLFVSIHMNYYPGKSVNGLRIFYSANHSEIKPLAEKMQERMSKVTGAKTTSVKAADKTLFLMKNPPLPAILAECGFLSNAEEEAKLNNEDYQARLAWAIADAIEKYYQPKL